MKEKRYWIRAVGVAAATFFSALLVYDRPPELAAYWQPALQAVLSGLAALGLNVGTRSGN